MRRFLYPAFLTVSLSVCTVGVLWPNGWMGEDATWYTEVDLGPGHIVLDGDPATRERGTASPLFSVHVCYELMATVAVLSTATVELLFNFTWLNERTSHSAINRNQWLAQQRTFNKP